MSLSHLLSQGSKVLCLSVAALTLTSCDSNNTNDSTLSHVNRHDDHRDSYRSDRLYSLAKINLDDSKRWRDYIADNDRADEEGLFFIQFEGRKGTQHANSNFQKNITIHCKNDPDRKSVEVDIKQYNDRTYWVTPGIVNPCVDKGGLHKITAKGEYKADKEELAEATLEYFFTRDMDSAGPSTRYSDRDRRDRLSNRRDRHDNCERYRDCGFFHDELNVFELQPKERYVEDQKYHVYVIPSRLDWVYLKYKGSTYADFKVEPSLACMRDYRGDKTSDPRDRIAHVFRPIDTDSLSWETDAVSLQDKCDGRRGGPDKIIMKGWLEDDRHDDYGDLMIMEGRN